MNQMTLFILFMTGLTILFAVMGVAGTNNPVFQVALSPTSASVASWVITIIAALTVGGGLIYGFLSRNAELQTMSLVVPAVLLILSSFTEVVFKIFTYSPLICALVLVPIIILFWVTIPDYWRGRD